MIKTMSEFFIFYRIWNSLIFPIELNPKLFEIDK